MVDFITFCWHRDIARMHTPGFLKKLVDQHDYKFDNIILIHQNCKGITCEPITDVPGLKIFDTSDYPDVLQEYVIPIVDPIAEENCHGPGAAHYWKDHCINHCVGAKVSEAAFLLFSDSDVTIERNGPPSWVETGVNALKRYRNVFMVCPDEGGTEHDAYVQEGRLTQYISQQIFMVNRLAFRNTNLAIPWNWPAVAPNRPYREFYAMLEGRMWRWMDNQNLYRLVLDGAKWRYWHHNPTSTMFTKVL